MIEQVARCDNPECRALRGETNHWWVLGGNKVGFYLRKWHEVPDPYESGLQHLCSQACAMRTFSKYMTAQ